MKFDLRYSYSDKPVAHGERIFVFTEDGRLFVRTGVKSNTTDQITYTLREVYDANRAVAGEPTNTPPVGGDVTSNLIVEPSR